ncbi:MAG: hypothetical protein JWP63_2342 [Candidatus Solibacter sp.]|nr:hypothetical protein [Candidatus Solibacter sp.]
MIAFRRVIFRGAVALPHFSVKFRGRGAEVLSPHTYAFAARALTNVESASSGK